MCVELGSKFCVELSSAVFFVMFFLCTGCERGKRGEVESVVPCAPPSWRQRLLKMDMLWSAKGLFGLPIVQELSFRWQQHAFSGHSSCSGKSMRQFSVKVPRETPSRPCYLDTEMDKDFFCRFDRRGAVTVIETGTKRNTSFRRWVDKRKTPKQILCEAGHPPDYI